MNKNVVDKKTIKKGILPWLIILVVMLGVFYYFNVSKNEKHDFTYDEFMEKLDKDNKEA